MEMKLLVLFIVMNIINVILQTIKSIATVKCGKWGAAIVNAVAYGLHTYIVVLTMCDLPLLAKCLIVAGANFVGVYMVKLIEEKARKDKVWKIEATAHQHLTNHLRAELRQSNIPHNCIENIGEYTIFNIYCPTQIESAIVKEILDGCECKYFVSESKTL